MFDSLLRYDLGEGVEAFFSARREGIQCGRTVSTIRLANPVNI